MGKLLSWVVLIALAWLVIHLVTISRRRRERSRAAGADRDGTRSAGAPNGTLEGEPIVPCAHCGLFVPASDAVRDGERLYCSAAHRDAARQAQGAGGERGARPRSRDE